MKNKKTVHTNCPKKMQLDKVLKVTTRSRPLALFEQLGQYCNQIKHKKKGKIEEKKD